MKVLIGGIPQEYADGYAARLMEQGRALPAPPVPPAPKADKAKGVKKGVNEHEPKGQD